MKIILISDVHAKWKKLVIPECDLLVSTGDYSFRGEKHIVEDFHEWLSKQPAKHIISVQGNHETWVEKNFAEAKEIARQIDPKIHFIDEGAIEIDGVKIYCSAVTPWFYNWAWNVNRGPDIAKHWAKIPDDTQVLLTHGPPHGILDMTYHIDGVTPREEVGCEDLLERIKQLKFLKLHAFGHIHSGSGEITIDGVTYINASICDETYQPTNPVREFIL